MTEEIEILKRMLKRERLARKMAESKFDKKNFELETINSKLEELVDTRTKELELLSKFPSQNPSPVMRIQYDGTIDYANTSSQRLLKYWNIETGERCPEGILSTIQQCLDRNENIEIEIIDNYDNLKIYNFILSPVIQFNYVFAYGRDITSLKKTQSELLESKNVYQQLVEEANDIIHRTNLNGNFTYVNPIASKIIGFSEEEILGLNYASLIKDDFKTEVADFYMKQYAEQKIDSYLEFPIITKDGKEVWVGQNSKLIFRNNIPIGFHSVVRDITERKIAEKKSIISSNRLTALISNLQVGVLMEDENRKIILANQLFCDFFSIPIPTASLIGIDCSNMAEQSKHLFKDPDIFESRLNVILADRKLVINEEIELVNGKFLERDYIPIYIDQEYMGHLWKYQDITEKKNVDRKILAQKEFYENILNNIPTDIAVFDLNHKYLFLNPEAIKSPELRQWIVGKDDYEYLAYRGKDLKLAEDRRNKFNHVLETKKMLKWEEQLLDPNGNKLYRLRHLCPVIDNNNVVTNVIGLGIDITDKRLIEDELRQNEQKLNIINQISHELIVNQHFTEAIQKALSYVGIAIGCNQISIFQQQKDEETSHILLNHRFSKSIIEDKNLVNEVSLQNINLFHLLNEKEYNEILLGNHFEISGKREEITFINDSSKTIMFFPVFNQHIIWGFIVFEFPFQIAKWDLSTIDILSSFSNTIGGAITRKESEDNLKAIVTSLDDIVLQINKQYQYQNLWVSDQSKLKFTKDKYINKYIDEFVTKELAIIFKEAIQEVLHTKEIRIFEYQSLETKKYYRCKICYLNQENVSALVQDITLQKNAELELVKAREKAEQSVKVKEHFLANMSHEIRTPMNAIIGMSKILYKTPLSEKQTNYLNAINSSSKNLLGIINDILDFSKIDSNGLVLENINFKITEVMADVFSTFQYKAIEKNLVLNFIEDSSISKVLIGDPLRLNQILINLINNAIKFTHEGEIVVSFKKVESDSVSNTIEFSISDTGIGIHKEKIESIFESFTQEDESITRIYGGTGLGLAICKELVELQGGKIKVESEKNVGTTFTFRIKYQIGNENYSAPALDNNSITKDYSSISLLLVEDNDINIFLAQTILENAKIKVDIAENGAIAIDKLKLNRYDIVLMDMQMPIMDGVEATRIIRNTLHLTLPIIALTANAINGDEKRCIEAGMNDYISKPFDEDTLISKIDNLLKNRISILNTEDIMETSSLYSLDKLISMSRGNDAFVTKMIKLFIEITPESLSSIKKHFYNNEYDKVKSIAHSIKPSIDVMNIKGGSEEIRLIESFMDQNISSKDIESVIISLESKLLVVIAELQKR